MTGLRRTVGLGWAATVVAALAVPSCALAGYGPGAEPASAAGTRLATDASSLPSVSDDGRYVVYDTFAPELLGASADPSQGYDRGLVRKDTRTGAVALVAPPRRVDADGATVSAGAWGTASLSGNGRYVAFETTEALSPTDRNGALDVYVRDMDRPVTDGNAYELASALDGGADAPQYATGGSRTGPVGFGLSDDGRTAVFFTSGVSNLPAGGAVATPADQVLVRRLDARRTIAITQPVDGGKLPNPIISGDGTTVVWLEGDAAAQTRLLPGERTPIAALLWRRVDGGDTRRVGGSGDADDPACDPATVLDTGSESATGPCYGPFRSDIAYDDAFTTVVTKAPSISDDGLRVLIVSSATRRPFDAATARASASLYVADMRPGVSRKAGVTRPISIPGGGAAIGGGVLSGDGRYAALTSQSSGFDGPRMVGTIPASGFNTTEVWIADLGAGSIQRATTAPDGADYHGAPLDPDVSNSFVDPGPAALALDDGARTLAFAAGDGNLFVGDANGVLDVEVIRGSAGGATGADAPTALPVPVATGAPVGAASFPPLVAPRAVHPVVGYAVVGRDGIARVTVRVPAAGALTGEATTRSGGRTARVARVNRTAKAASTVTLRLAPAKAIRKRLRSRAIKVTIAIRYKPTAGATTTVERTATYPRRKPTR